jgi:hypothetical protein
MAPTIHPKQTRYSGWHFRSRLEARWAVFMDAMGVEWEYESEGYDLGGSSYLPDFWIPAEDPWARSQGWGQWLEVKPCWPLEASQVALYDALVRKTGHRLIAVCGTPWGHRAYVFQHHHKGEPRVPFCDDAYLLGTGAGASWVSRATRLILPFAWHGGFELAITWAKSARFEHGESGPT